MLPGNREIPYDHLVLATGLQDGSAARLGTVNYQVCPFDQIDMIARFGGKGGGLHLSLLSFLPLICALLLCEIGRQA